MTVFIFPSIPLGELRRGVIRLLDRRQREVGVGSFEVESTDLIDTTVYPEQAAREQWTARIMVAADTPPDDGRWWFPQGPVLADARARGEALLMDVLSPAQRHTFVEHHYFDVHNGTRVFRVYKGTTSNIVEITPGIVRRTSYCIVPGGSEWMPPEDTWVHQKMVLDADLSQFWAMAVPDSVPGHWELPQSNRRCSACL